MSAPQPQTIANDLQEQLHQLALNAGRTSNVQSLMKLFMSECDKLQNVDVIMASLLKSNFFALAGNRKDSEYWTRNAVQNGGRQAATPYIETNLFLMGYISEAYAHFENAFMNRGNRPASTYARKALSIGLFRKANWVISQLDAQSIPDELKALATKGQAVIDQLGITDQQICALMDEAHQLIREKGLIWLDEFPKFNLNDGNTQLCITYRVEITPDEAADLTWQLIDRLIAKDLASIGLVVGYQGTVLNTSERVAFAN